MSVSRRQCGCRSTMNKTIAVLDALSPALSTNLIMYSLRKVLLPLLLSTQAIATGCDKPLPVKAGSTTKTSITSGGLDREYLLHVPITYDATKKVPLIFSFHGRGKNASGQMELSQFANPDFNPDAISVFPNGVKVSTSLFLYLDFCPSVRTYIQTQILLQWNAIPLPIFWTPLRALHTTTKPTTYIWTSFKHFTILTGLSTRQMEHANGQATPPNQNQ